MGLGRWQIQGYADLNKLIDDMDLRELDSKSPRDLCPHIEWAWFDSNSLMSSGTTVKLILEKQ